MTDDVTAGPAPKMPPGRDSGRSSGGDSGRSLGRDFSSAATPLDWSRLRRWPDTEAPNLAAVSAADRLILAEAAAAVAAAPPASVVTVDDSHGALTLGAAGLGATGVRAIQDSATAEAALAANAAALDLAGSYVNETLSGAGMAGARVVLLHLPKDLVYLESVAHLIAAAADPDVVVYAGGRIKHMTKRMNDVLLRYFSQLDVTHARQKSRVLVATRPRGDVPAWDEGLKRRLDPELGFDVCAAPGVFAAGRLDMGTRFLLRTLEHHPLGGDIRSAADLGSGAGVIAAWLLREYPQLHVLATDVSRQAARATACTLAATGFPRGRYQVERQRGLTGSPADSLDLVVCNPPFHAGAALSEQLAHQLFADAARALRPGGQMVTVYNSHLPHRRALQRLVGPTQQLARDPKFTVTLSRAR